VTSNDSVAVCIAVLTFRRPDDIAKALPMLLAQADEVSVARDSSYAVEVLVIDNDPAASAASIVESIARPELRYVVEPEPGIAAARNRALRESAGADMLVFIDDDERPHESWLQRLLDTKLRTGAVAVAGAVVSEYEGPVDPWVTAGGFFVRRRLPTSTQIDMAATNNLLLDLHEIRRLGLRFDPEFGLSGGEDTLFTRTIVARGGLMVWCDEAIVTDWVPSSRMSRGWVLRRALSSGNSVSRVELRLAAGARQRLRARFAACTRGMPRILGGVGRWVAGICTGSPKHQARGLRTMARGAGMVSGAFGYVFQEYKRDE
jgi:succinoglycan biosynthesis protein ExoM